MKKNELIPNRAGRDPVQASNPMSSSPRALPSASPAERNPDASPPAENSTKNKHGEGMPLHTAARHAGKTELS